MDERRNTIKELEANIKSETEERNRLLIGLGETLLFRIGADDALLINADNESGSVLIEYRRLQKEIADAEGNIKSIEKTIEQLKELEEAITGKENEYSRLDRELAETNIELGKALLLRLDTKIQERNQPPQFWGRSFSLFDRNSFQYLASNDHAFCLPFPQHRGFRLNHV